MGKAVRDWPFLQTVHRMPQLLTANANASWARAGETRQPKAVANECGVQIAMIVEGIKNAPRNPRNPS
jgi:hypothetical protein